MLRRASDRIAIYNIGNHVSGAASITHDVGSDALEIRTAARHQHHACPAPRRLLRCRQADPATGAGHDDDLSVDRLRDFMALGLRGDALRSPSCSIGVPGRGRRVLPSRPAAA